MAEERERLCAHIRAAQDWLGRAESSLERENDVKGDLSLMLAEAELQRARETQKKKRLMQFLTPTLALVLVLGGIFLVRSMEAPVETKYANGVMTKGAPAAVEKEAVHSLPEPMNAARKTDADEEREKAVEGEAMFVEVQSEKNMETIAAAESAPMIPESARIEKEAPQAAPADAAALPATEMQKLMLAAGRVLRE